jgi:hypothetical protein
MNRMSLLCALLLASCAGDDGAIDPGCVGEKCDRPDGVVPAATSCERRRADALSTGQRAYTAAHIRWACSDVAGVNAAGSDSRGQEYCEYFAVVQPPAAGGQTPAPVALGRRIDDRGTTPLELPLVEEQIFWLEDHPAEIVGQCVFTSWHSDVLAEYPGCPGAACPRILGFAITGDFLRMKDGSNSNFAASDLVEQCYRGSRAAAPPDDAYTRGCMIAADNWRTEWRRSDPTICAAIMRLGECGCGLDADGDGDGDLHGKPLADRLVPAPPPDGPPPLRGFPLGSWSSPSALPAGCRLVATGDDSRTLVSCDLTADDVLKNRTDPKGACRAKYGDDVVVHIPVPGSALVCQPPAGGAFASGCGATPWML